MSETSSSWWIGTLPSCSICGSMTQPCPQGALHSPKNRNSCALSFSNQIALGFFGADHYFDEKQPMCEGVLCDFRALACACVRLRATFVHLRATFVRLRAPSCDLRAPSCDLREPSCAFVRPSCDLRVASCTFVHLRAVLVSVCLLRNSQKSSFWRVLRQKCPKQKVRERCGVEGICGSNLALCVLEKSQPEFEGCVLESGFWGKCWSVWVLKPRAS